MSLVGFTLLGTIEAPTITGAATGVPLLVKPNTEFTAAMKAALDVGGGDLRFSSDAAGLNQLACEIVDGLDIVWVKPTGVSISSGATLYVWGDNTGASQPAVGAAFGRDAVWVDSDRRYHFEQDPSVSDMVDASGNVDGVRVGAFVSGDKVAGAIGSALKFTLDTNYLTSGVASTPANQPKTVSYITQFQTLSSQKGLFSLAGSGTDSTPSVLFTMRSSSVDVLDSDAIYQDVFVPSTLTNYKIDYVYNGTTTTVYVDNVVEVSYPSGDGVYVVGVGNLYINNGYDNQADQVISEFEYSEYAKTADQISIEYNNQSELGSWWIASDTGGSTITVPATLGTISYTGQGTTVSITGSIDVTATLGTIAYASNNTAVDISGSVDVIATLGTIDYTNNSTTVGIAGSVDVTTTIGTISYTSSNATVSVTGAVDVIATLGTIDYSSSNVTVDVTGSVDVLATLGTITYTPVNPVVSIGGAIVVPSTLGTITYSSNDAVISLQGVVSVPATLGTISYSSNNTVVSLAGLIDVNATLGTISYTSNNTVVTVAAGQALGVVGVGFADDLYSSIFKPDSITVTFRG